MRTVRLILALCFASLLAACATVERASRYAQEAFRPMPTASAKGPAKKEGQITFAELDQLTYAYADRYLTNIASACDAIERDNPNAEQRRRANQVKLVQVGAVYDIATNADPFTRLLDLTLVVTLQSRQWIDEDEAERQFGTRGAPLIAASRRTREDIWQVAARVLTPEQLELLDYLIWEWRTRNRDVTSVSYVRFDEFASSRGKSIVSDVKSGQGLLAPVDDALKAVDEARLLAERAFFYAKRTPAMLSWQARAAADDITGGPQISELTRSVSLAAGTMERMPALVAAERRAIFEELARSQPLFARYVSDARLVTGDTTTMATALTGLTDSSQRLIAALDQYTKQRSADGHPFDIREYAATLDKLAVALKEANQLAGTTTGLVGGLRPDMIDAWSKAGTGHVTASVERVMDGAFWRGVALIGVFFAVLLLYRWLTLRLNLQVAVKVERE